MAWMVLLSPVHLASPRLYYRIEEAMFSWMLSMVACWSWSAGYNIVESGDCLDSLSRHKFLLLPNHQVYSYFDKLEP